MSKAVIGLGSNLLDRERNLLKALKAIANLPGTTILKMSAVYETKPFAVPDPQEDYLNCCIEVETSLQPMTLLGGCLGIESAMGRKRPYKNAPRVIDIDLLIYENVCLNERELTMPHAGIHERAFVLVPLGDLYADGMALGFCFAKALHNVSTEGVVLYKKSEDFLRVCNI